MHALAIIGSCWELFILKWRDSVGGEQMKWDHIEEFWNLQLQHQIMLCEPVHIVLPVHIDHSGEQERYKACIT